MPASVLEWCTPLVGAVALSILWLAEGFGGLWLHGPERVRHGARNVAMGAINAVVRALFLPGLLLGVTVAARQSGFGLLNRTEWPAWVELAAAVLLLDLWGYVWHVVSHHIPLLWRFHAVHHHDAQMDSTTALRFHFGDIVLASLSLLAVAPLLGVSVPQILVYELILIPSSIFHHANVRLPRNVDRALGWVIVTPSMHIVHHSRWHVETDSNYSAIFSFWDRLFGTLRRSADPGSIRPGLDGYRVRDHATLRGMLATPLGRIRSQPGRAPGERARRHVHSGDGRSIPRPRHFRAH